MFAFVESEHRDIRSRYASERERLEGRFAPDELTALLSRFSFFHRMLKALQPADVWTDSLLPLHPYACFDDFSLVYMNSAVTCGTDDERGKLVVGSMDLRSSLSALAERNPGKPVIMLAHHSHQLFPNREQRELEKIFRSFPDTALYLCGDEHSPWGRIVNMLPQFTAGCLVGEQGTDAVFYAGELRGGLFHPPRAHRWDNVYSRWDTYPQADAEAEKMLSSLRNRFFFAWHDTVSNLSATGMGLSPHFTGREAYLEKIHTTFRNGGAVSLVQSIKGLGGVGKTQLALKYAHAHKSQYRYLWWIDAASESGIVDGYRAFLQKLQLVADSQASPELYIRKVRDWMSENDGWLFIFDNADAVMRDGKPVQPDEMLRDFLPSYPEGSRHVLITSRYINWHGMATGIDVDVFSPEEAGDFLTGFTGLPSDGFQADLAEKLSPTPGSARLFCSGRYCNHLVSESGGPFAGTIADGYPG